MKEHLTLGELRDEFKQIDSVVSGDTAFIAKALMYDLERKYGRGYLTRQKRKRRESKS